MPCATCQGPLPTTPRAGTPRRYCSVRCRRERHWRAQMARRREARARARRTGEATRGAYTSLVEELRQEVPRHLCCYCDGPLPPRCRVHCGDVQCRRLYNRDYQAVRRAARRQRGGVCTSCTKPLPEGYAARCCERCLATSRRAHARARARRAARREDA